MKNLFIALAALVAVGCSKSGGYDPEDPKNDPRVQAIVGTTWEYVDDNVSAVSIEFKSETRIWLTKTRWVFHPADDKAYMTDWYEEFPSAYCYDYTVSDNGEISMKIAPLSDWYPDDGTLIAVPDDYKGMPPLIGSISGTSMSLLKTDGATYVTLEKKVN